MSAHFDLQGAEKGKGALFIDFIPFGVSYFHTTQEWTLYLYLAFFVITFMGERPIRWIERVRQDIALLRWWWSL